MEPITDTDLLKLLHAIYRFSTFNGSTEAAAIEACDRISNLASNAVTGVMNRIVVDEKQKTDAFIAELRQR